MDEPNALKYVVFGMTESDKTLAKYGYKYNPEENTWEKLVTVTEKAAEADWIRGRCLGFMITAP